MTWTAPRDWSTNEVLTSANMDTYVSDNLRWLNEDRPRCTMAGTVAAATGAAFVVPTGTGGGGAWDTSPSPNTGGMFVSSSAMYMYAPTSGSYQFSLMVVFNTSATGKRGAVISSAAVNLAYTTYAIDVREATSGTETTAITITTPLIKFNSPAYVHFGIRQSQGSSMNCSVRFSGLWVAS